MDFRFTLESCIIELDVSLYDRLNFILAPSPFDTNSSLDYNIANESSVEATITTNKHGEPITELNVEAPSLDIHLR